MPIDFDADRWEQVKETYRLWWEHELERPIIPVYLTDRDPGRSQPEAPLLSQATCADLSIPAAAIIDRADYELSRITFLGDAFPSYGLDFGPGVIAAFLGGRLDNSSGRVWFHPERQLPIDEIHFEFDPDNVWFRRVMELYEAGMERWRGQVLMSMTDIGGNLDILSTFRPAERLLLDLYDSPDEVKRLTWEAHEAWHKYYQAINELLRPDNPGNSDWSGIFSEEPSYMLQCDFSYMIGPEMFDEIVKPELEATTRRLPHTFYHLDGVGQLNHLDSVLAMRDLNGVQWVPGDGKPGCDQWPEVYEKISASGKMIQIIHGDLDAIAAVCEQIGTTRGVEYYGMWGTAADEVSMREELRRYGIS